MTSLAVLGGPAVVPEGVDESRWPDVDEADVDAVVATLRSGRLSWLNDTEVAGLEQDWAAYVGTRHCLAVNSGTAALHAAVAAVGVGPGDEVLVPALSFLASATAVIHHQAIPVFVDVDPVTFTVDPAALEAQRTARTKAVVAVHLHGLPVDMDPVLAFARRHGLAVVEDAAQAHGATYFGRAVGSLGDVAAFSIMAGKNLPTAGEGGLLTTDDAELRDRADAIKMFGEQALPDGARDQNPHTIGYNYRLSSILAAFTRSQLTRLPQVTKEAQAGAERLTSGLADIPGVLPPVVPEGRTHVYHHYRVRLDPAAAGVDLPVGVFRQAVQDALRAEGVPAASYQTRPLPGQTLFRERVGYGKGCPWSCGHARDVAYRMEDYPRALGVIRGSLVLGDRLALASLREPAVVERYLRAFAKVFAHLDELYAYARSLDYHEPWDAPARLS